ncbi:D-sedoheptulose-7-phosphate isomerase [Legionella jordanis]|uniref:DnaA initiator-associating factor for replication initiation n=1 Tax=Legionella jordanis TaxID=456 RepID=A0A0W0VCM9_9GAMM|nr:SIS domain-containing protein [Legionella jordanis]KTD17890.1 DnaA initiator-associating factor for replication initiation [Legionella jordanis]RMX02411.1 SIS domain-containing protein [Legionella jordanis]RMX21746.1 SIS domain-containing protein [Legionella jordanis]VEH14019.1 DnaA initiator-associating factor for replication initiation [Legionella jordanis]HAT8713860.1 SIS domain-containing protein [Legionella jordanis]
MTQMEERVRQLFGASIESQIAVADALTTQVAKAGQRLANCLLNDGKILLCGNGGSAANCLHFSAAMMSHFEVERPSLPAIALTSDVSAMTSVANNSHYDQVFARQIHALGQEEDVLIVLSTSGNADNILQAVNAANDRGMDSIALTGRDGGLLANHLGPEDIELRVINDNAARIREIHLFILHCFCDLIDQSLFGQMMG